MFPTLLFSLCWITIISIPLSSAQCYGNENFRRRRPWSKVNQDLYLDALLELQGLGHNNPINSRLQHFPWQYYHAINGGHDQDQQARTESSAYLPWNRYFLWELESQIRDLGGKYENFALPYWDWTEELVSNPGSTLDFEILNSGLGGTGNPNDNGCIQESPFGDGAPDFIKQYHTFDCPEDIANSPHVDSIGECCLERHTEPTYQGVNALSASGLINIVLNNPDYVNFKDKIATLLEPIQVLIGGVDGNLADPDSAPDDPIYFLMYSFVDSLWALWQNCHGYDKVLSGSLTGNDEIYSGNNVGPSQIDAELDFEIFITYSDEARIKFGGFVDRDQLVESNPFGDLAPPPPGPLTIRDMHRMRDWGYCYENGVFHVNKMSQLLAGCPAVGGSPDNVNPFAFGRSDSFVAPERPDRAEYLFGTDIIWARLVSSLNLDDSSTADLPRPVFAGIINQWSQIDCELSQSEGGRIPCKRPKCFDDCSGLLPCDGEGDINVTLSELIEKVEDYPCMVQTRKRLYAWAKANVKLLELCRGDFDNFCDGNDIDGQSTLDTCSVSEDDSPKNKKWGRKNSDDYNGGRDDDRRSGSWSNNDDGRGGNDDGRRGNDDGRKGNDYRGGDDYGRSGKKRYSAQTEGVSVISEPNKGGVWRNYGAYMFIAIITVVFNLIAYGATYMYYVNKNKDKIVTKY